MTEVPVRVAVRVRPLIGQEVVRNVTQCVHTIPEKAQLILGKDRGFTFDHVFPTSTSQNEIYEICVEPLLKSCFEGYNATVFAYGQTGSGKTYTIGGTNMAGLLEEEYGIVPRAAEQIFQIIEERKHKTNCTVRVSYIEIYMEELRDLLDLETSSKDIHIREDENGNTVVTGASEQVVNSADEVMSCLDVGSAGRHFGTTNMNEHSSRSHSVFTVYIDQRPVDVTNLDDLENEQKEQNVIQDSDYSEYMFAKFHFVDLAGSERARRTGNVGERFKESVFINSGLLALGNVISSLADSRKKVTHVPYRDSKVTRLLKDSLGGNARTVMITCLSPAAEDFAENLNSLKYATRARNIRNKPVVNRDPQNARIAEMQNEIQALREELQRHRGSTVGTTGTTVNSEHIRSLEEELDSCRSSCEMYKQSVLSAAAQLKSLYKAGAMSSIQSSQYERWIKSLEQFKGKFVSTPAANKQNQCEVIEQLRQDLNKYKEDLASDEEIFAEKAKEINGLTDHIRELQEENTRLDQQLSDAIIRLKRQEDQLFHQQLQLNQHLLGKHNHALSACAQQEERLVLGSSSNEPTRRDRAFSEPVDVANETSHQRRKLYTSSPTLITMERIIEGFRARNQLLVSQHEEEDEVIQTLSDTSESEDDEEEKPGSKVLGRTWNTGKKKTGINSQIPVINGKNNNKKCQVKSKLLHPKLEPQLKKEAENGVESETIKELRCSTQVIKREVEESELRLHDAQQKLRDLTMSVRYKEELVRELVKSEKEAKEMKKQYNEKIRLMKLEVEKARKDLEEAKKALEEVESKANFEISEKQKLENEYKKKLHSVEAKLHALKKKQKDKEKVTTFYEEREKKVQELESHIQRMRSQQESLQKRLKEEADKKAKREREMQKHLQKIKDLEIQTLQQQKLLKRKTEEVAVAQRRLRNINKQGSEEKESVEHSKLEQRRQWLDAEVEKFVKRKQAIQGLEDELKKREKIVADKEAMLAERSELEMKKLRSSQVLNKDILRLSTQLVEVDRKIQEKGKYVKEHQNEDGAQHTKSKEDLGGLHRTREELLKQRELLEQKLQEGTLLTPAEERRLIELDEGIEALDAAIEFKNDTITSQQQQLEINETLTAEKFLAENERNLLKARLATLAPDESVMLLSKYFVKVVELREAERQLHLQCADMNVRVKEQERIIGELGRGLQQSEMKAERKLTEQQRDYEQKIQFLLHKANEPDIDGASDARIQELEYKSQQLEKELYYYKKSSRDLKKKLREYIAGTQGESGPVGSSVGSEVDAGKELTANVLRMKQSLQEQTVGSPSQASTPVRFSRKDLRQLSAQEVSVRRSQSQSTAASSVGTVVEEQDSVQQSVNEDCVGVSTQDSIETGRNPWR